MKLIEIFKSNYGENAKEIGELAIDGLLEDGSILERIPLLNIVLATKNTITSIQDAFLIRKTIIFLKKAEQIPLEDRVNFISKHLNGKEEKFAEKVIHCITRLDDIEKSRFIAKLYRACVYELITLEEFYRLIRIIDLAYIGDLNYILSMKKLKSEYRGIEAYSLSSLGLFQEIPILRDPCSISEIPYSMTELGEVVKKCLCEEW